MEGCRADGVGDAGINAGGEQPRHETRIVGERRPVQGRVAARVSNREASSGLQLRANGGLIPRPDGLDETVGGGGGFTRRQRETGKPSDEDKSNVGFCIHGVRWVTVESDETIGLIQKLFHGACAGNRARSAGSPSHSRSSRTLRSATVLVRASANNSSSRVEFMATEFSETQSAPLCLLAKGPGRIRGL